MSKRRRKGRGASRAVFQPPESAQNHWKQPPEFKTNEKPNPASGKNSPPPASTELAPLNRAASTPVHPEAFNALTCEMSRFNHMLEDLLSRDRHGSRSPEERKEMWVLLSALTVVVVFCFVAFYLNHAEVREMHSGLQAEIDLAGQSAVSSMERSLASLRLERIPEAQESLDRFMKEKEHQDKQRFGEILEEVRKQGTRSQVGRREDFQTIDDHLSALRQLSEEIHQIQLQSLRNASRIPEDIALINPGNGEVKAGWAARAPDGAPRTGPPDSAERPPSQDSQEKVEKIETVGSEKPKSENTNDN